MSRDMKLLQPEFREKVEAVMKECPNMRTFFTLRDPATQMKLWRSSRSSATIEAMRKWLWDNDAPWLADLLINVGPQYGKGHVTWVVGGWSWHQWGLAHDAFALVDGVAIWDPTSLFYGHYSATAQRQGLTSGYNWSKQDAVHIQMTSKRVRETYDTAEVNRVMWERFG